MEKIKFYYEGKFLGEGELPQLTTGEDRRAIASALGISQYDRFEFIKSDGSVRAVMSKERGGAVFAKEFDKI